MALGSNAQSAPKDTNKGPDHSDDKIDPNAVQVDDSDASPDQTWVQAKDSDGETHRIKSEEYPAWEAEQERKRLGR